MEYFDGDDLAAKIFVDKYALRDNNKQLLEISPHDMFSRIASNLARIERDKFQNPLSFDDIFSYIDRFKYIVPQGGLLYGIGNKFQYVTLSNCYAIASPFDSYGGIHRTDEHITQISKRRGGCGVDVSTLRPELSPTTNSSRTSSGPISFMKRYSRTIREVGQDGRRGALMITMNVHHPNVLDFINSKRNIKEITGANISVRLTDEFLRAVKDDTNYEQRFPVNAENPTVAIRTEARRIWKAIIKSAWESAEPGILFWDNILRESIADCYSEDGFNTITTNPCSELPLCEFDSCRLMLLNLFSYVEQPFTKESCFDFRKFYNHVNVAQRLMDDVVDLELEAINKIINKVKEDPEPSLIKATELDLWDRIKDKCELGRRTGLGTTALADTFAALNLRYGSKESINLTDKIFKTLKFSAFRSSVEMAKELGAFPIWNWKKEKDNPYLNRFRNQELQIEDETIEGYDIYHDIEEFGRRNIGLLTNSPAGTVSLECRTSQAIEPVYELITRRRKKVNPSDEGITVDFIDESGDKWMEFDVFHPNLRKWMEATGKNDIKESPWWGSCAKDIGWKERIAIQAAAQRQIDHSISSTVNLQKSVTQKTVGEIYEAAWEAGLKGITVYREGCRDGVILSVENKHRELPRTEAPERPRELKCDVHHTNIDGRPYFVIVGLWVDGTPYEVFAGKNGFLPAKVKSGTIVRKRKGYYRAKFDDTDLELSPITASSTEMEGAITRLTSTSLRHGADIHTVVKQLEKVGEEGSINCFARGIARTLKKYIEDGTLEKGELCPECIMESLVRQSGCITCNNCGWSKCV